MLDLLCCIWRLWHVDAGMLPTGGDADRDLNKVRGEAGGLRGGRIGGGGDPELKFLVVVATLTPILEGLRDSGLGVGACSTAGECAAIIERLNPSVRRGEDVRVMLRAVRGEAACLGLVSSVFTTCCTLGGAAV
mmetsp:Transcript_8487/g.19966  ORF Transcript_8487/g.19966 Transcript_8487/m.19966 type:complete len:134 (-) Transcript_8487:579-980(-)